MARLAESFDALRRDGDRFTITAPEAWAQGRTLYGGMTMALAHEAARRYFDDLPPLRSAQCVFVGPAAGRVHFLPGILRKGRSTTMVAVEAVSDDGPVLRASFVFGSSRDSAVAVEAPGLPEVSTPDEAIPLFATGNERAPGFTANFDMRLGGGAQGVSGGEPMMATWAKFRDPPGGDPVSALLALADAPPPAAITRFPQVAPLSSVTWHIDLVARPEEVDGWHLLRAEAEHSGEGMTTQDMKLWREDGQLLAIGRQNIAIFA
ncbi:thioesterase family protein [Sphingomicrobium aestuariivivum]|uniref:thioesterase family protein n=1 Tax=Sphingomicrobium aestuariivivum TaxID=1582356 RepID=UPI001FD6C2A7|nr:thioesterase family protein [Sphingomicrobium aestuariivivum]MCJ8191923.1 thioesterase family protein [Sphingomicrobium aestuariivivum]